MELISEYIKRQDLWLSDYLKDSSSFMKRIPLKLEGVSHPPKNSFFKKAELQSFIGENKNHRVYTEEAIRLARGSGNRRLLEQMLFDSIYNSIEFENANRISYHAFEEGEPIRGATSRIFFTT